MYQEFANAWSNAPNRATKTHQRRLVCRRALNKLDRSSTALKKPLLPDLHTIPQKQDCRNKQDRSFVDQVQHKSPYPIAQTLKVGSSFVLEVILIQISQYSNIPIPPPRYNS